MVNRNPSTFNHISKLDLTDPINNINDKYEWKGNTVSVQNLIPSCSKCGENKNVKLIDVICKKSQDWVNASLNGPITEPLWGCTKCNVIFSGRSKILEDIINQHIYPESGLEFCETVVEKGINSPNLKNFTLQQDIDMLKSTQNTQEVKILSLENTIKEYETNIQDSLFKLREKVNGFSLEI